MDRCHLPERIEGERIYLEKVRLDLAPVMFQYVDQDRERLRRFLPWVDLTRTLEDEEAYLKTTLQWWKDHEQFDYGIFLKDGSLYMGNLGVHTISWQNNRCELGYWLLGSFEGKGYMVEAVRILERTLFRIGFNRVEIHCSSLNKRSARVPELAGYTLEGTFRQDAIEQGEYRDTMIWGKLRSDPV